MLLSLPFNTQFATILLFTIIAYWSRLPGVGIPHPFFIIYSMDFVDFFTMLIAVNVGSFQGAIFTIFCNLASRASGTFPKWDAVLLDALFQSILCFICPIIFSITGNLLFTMLCFTVLRDVMYFLVWFIYPRWGFAYHIMLTIVAAVTIITINTFYTKLFGDFLFQLLEKGVKFNWILFLFTTIVILIFYISVFGLSKRKKKKKRRLLKKIITTVKHVPEESYPNKISPEKDVFVSADKELEDFSRIKKLI